MIKIEPHIDVITVSWNGREDTLECLASLARLTYPNHRVIVVDNGSTDGTVEAIHAQYPAVELIVNERNLGFQGGFNAGIRHALADSPDYVFVINNDTLVAPDVLEQLITQADPPDVGMLSPKIYYAYEADRIWSVGGDIHPITYEVIHKGDHQIDRGQWNTVLEREFLTACAVLMKRSMLEQIGLYDTGFHPAYYEDIDLCVRARHAGWRMLMVPDAKLWHKGAASSGGWGSPAERYLMARHSVRYFRKYVHGWRWLVVGPYRLGSALKMTLRLALRRRFDSIAAYWRGLRDGCRAPIVSREDLA